MWFDPASSTAATEGVDPGPNSCLVESEVSNSLEFESPPIPWTCTCLLARLLFATKIASPIREPRPAIEPTTIPMISSLPSSVLEVVEAAAELVGDARGCVGKPLDTMIVDVAEDDIDEDLDDDDAVVEFSALANNLGILIASELPQQSLLAPQHHVSLVLVPSQGVIRAATPPSSPSEQTFKQAPVFQLSLVHVWR